jgi:quinolinate synthase
MSGPFLITAARAAGLEEEAERLFRALLPVDCEPDRTWDYAACRRIAPLTLEINRLKRRMQAVILAHSYVEPEIIYGVADFKGDSYALSVQARDSRAPVILFAGVVFMAETAKILSPQASVRVPDPGSGCSLAEAMDGPGLDRLKARHPDAAVVCYINSTAAVKARADVCVTSANAGAIIERLPQRRILFVPDRLMAANLRAELARRGVDKEIIAGGGACLVHERFDPAQADAARRQFPGLRVVAHPECPPAVAAAADFVGSTGAMMRYVRATPAPYFLLLTECGLVGRLQVETPGKRFVGGCRLCPHMKRNSLEKVHEALAAPRPEQIITLDEEVRRRAAGCLERMFALAPAD